MKTTAGRGIDGTGYFSNQHDGANDDCNDAGDQTDDQRVSCAVKKASQHEYEQNAFSTGLLPILGLRCLKSWFQTLPIFQLIRDFQLNRSRSRLVAPLWGVLVASCSLRTISLFTLPKVWAK